MSDERGPEDLPPPAPKPRRKPTRSAATRQAKPPTASSPEDVADKPGNMPAEPARKPASTRRKTGAVARRGASVQRKAPASEPTGGRVSKLIDAGKAGARTRTAMAVGAAAAGMAAGFAINLGRKALVQAPSASAGDWFAALKVEHAQALSIFDRLQAIGDGSPAQRSAVFVELKKALSKHAFTEENVIYPVLRDQGRSSEADKLNHEHGYVKQHLFALETLDKGSPDFLARAALFRSELETHIRKEEDELFPALQAGLDDDQNARLTAMANREGFKLA